MMNEKGVVLIEFADDEDGPVYLSKNDKVEGLAARSAEALEGAMGTITAVAEKVQATFADLPGRPDQAEIEFALTFKGEAGALIAKTSAEAGLKVKLTWKKAG
jgi:hypothetical protein